MPNLKQEVSLMMRRLREGRVPSSSVMVEEAFHELGYLKGKVSPDYVRDNFNQMLHSVWQKTLEVLERYEARTYSAGIVESLIRLRPNDVRVAKKLLGSEGFLPAVRVLFERWYPYLRESFLSVSQSRKTRGGRDFELQFGGLLDLLGVPYEKKKRAHRVDFMMPSNAAFLRNPTSASVLSAKRTLRERWREVVEELQALRSPNIFLITADSDVSEGHVGEICDRYRIQLVVWDDLARRRFPRQPLVMGYTKWATKRLPVLERFWENNEVTK